MKKIVNQLVKITEEMMCNIARQQNVAIADTYTCNLIEGIRVVDNCSACDERNKLLLNRSRSRLSKGLFCVCNRRVYASL